MIGKLPAPEGDEEIVLRGIASDPNAERFFDYLRRCHRHAVDHMELADDHDVIREYQYRARTIKAILRVIEETKSRTKANRSLNTEKGLHALV